MGVRMCGYCGRRWNKAETDNSKMCPKCKETSKRLALDNEIWNNAIERVIGMCRDNDDFSTYEQEEHFIEQLKRLKRSEV